MLYWCHSGTSYFQRPMHSQHGICWWSSCSFQHHLSSNSDRHHSCRSRRRKPGLGRGTESGWAVWVQQGLVRGALSSTLGWGVWHSITRGPVICMCFIVWHTVRSTCAAVTDTCFVAWHAVAIQQSMHIPRLLTPCYSSQSTTAYNLRHSIILWHKIVQ